jgi:hypothetical protein
MSETRTIEIARAVQRIKPLLAGRPPDMVGAILADLLAIWIAGHQVEGDAKSTRLLRADLSQLHWAAVRELIPINAKILGTPP